MSVTLFSGFWAASSAEAVVPGVTPGTYTGTVVLDSTGTVDSNGFVTLSGTYRCSGPSKFAAVKSTVQRWGFIDSSAYCDGAEHTWVSRNRPDGPLVRVGQADVATRLEVWVTGNNGMPLPITFATDQKIVDIRAAAG
ncbi:DUF6299 family protein [Kitasatospora purpeofusca]|uniref:DUF6299 family protein n=1 Tax=Kitasatospora purpeofusca TaxID=67352 RepID=UPI0036D3A446